MAVGQRSQRSTFGSPAPNVGQIRPPANIEPANGRLGVLMLGRGAVSTTFMAGVELARRDVALPIGSLMQRTIRLGMRTEHRSPAIRDFVRLDRLVFGGRDVLHLGVESYDWDVRRLIGEAELPAAAAGGAK